MLVLTRKAGERIVLPDLGITVVVHAVSGDRARLAFEAPRETRIYRQEVWDRLEAGEEPRGREADGDD